jgi:hypothetical protein
VNRAERRRQQRKRPAPTQGSSDRHWFVGFREIKADALAAAGITGPPGHKAVEVIRAGPVTTEEIAQAIDVLFLEDGCDGVYTWDGEPDMDAIQATMQRGGGLAAASGSRMLIVPQPAAEAYESKSGKRLAPIGRMYAAEIQDLLDPNKRGN